VTNWAEQYEIIKDKISSEGGSPSLKGVADRLGVSRGKVQAWAGGQRPSADDLELIGRELGFSAGWLLFGEGPIYREEQGGAKAAAELAYEIKSLGHNGTIRRAQVVRGPDEQELGALIEVHAEAGAGPASERWEPEPIATVCIPPEYAKPGVFGLRIRGDSMDPLIKRGAFVGVDHEDRIYTSGDIYAIYMPYEGLIVKRLFHDPAAGEYVLCSVNPTHPDMRLPIEQSERLIVGRVVWVLQKF